MRLFNKASDALEEIKQLQDTTNLFDGSNSSAFGVIGLNNGAGATSTAVNLAIFLAQAGKRVLLHDCNYIQPNAYFYFNNLRITEQQSVVRYYLKQLKESDVNIKIPEFESLWITTATPYDKLEHILSLDIDLYRELLEYQMNTFDYVIFDLAYQPMLRTFLDAVELANKSIIVWDEQNDNSLKTHQVFDYFRNFSPRGVGTISNIVVNKRNLKTPYNHEVIENDLRSNHVADLPYIRGMAEAKDNGKNFLAMPEITVDYFRGLRAISEFLMK